MPTNEFYVASGWPAQSEWGDSASARAEIASIVAGFNKLPALSGQGSKIVRVNTGGTALESVTPETALSSWIQGGFKNAFINGDDQIAQINGTTFLTTTVPITAGAAINYAIDQWYTQSTGQNITFRQVAGTAPFQFASKLAAGATGPTTTLFGTRMEGKNCVKYTNKYMALQVGIICDVPMSVTWTAYYANVLDTFSAKTQIATGTFSATAGQATYFANFNAGPNAGNGLCVEFTTGALTNNTGFITYSGRQLEPVLTSTSLGTAFEFARYDDQLRWCQWFTRKLGGNSLYDITVTGIATAGAQSAQANISYPDMRATPNGSVVGTWSVANCGQPAITVAGKSSTVIGVAATAAGTFQTNTTGTSTYILLQCPL